MRTQGVLLLLSLTLVGFWVSVSGARVKKDLLTVESIHEKIRSKKYNCSEIIDYFIDKSVRYNRHLNAIISFNIDKAKLQALQQDELFYKTNQFAGKLHCIPVFVKDNIDLTGVPSTGGIKSLRYSIPNQDATVVANLKREGAIILGKSNLAELGIGMRYESETGGACKNPYDTTRSCGASSSGSAAAVASGLAVFSLGTDTDGSIVGPACFNSLNGLRPARNAMDMNGIIPLFGRQDTVGPLTNYMDELVLAYSIMTNKSKLHDDYQDLLSRVKAQNETIRIGYITNTFSKFDIYTVLGNYSYYLDDEIQETSKNFIKNLGSLFPVKAITQNESDFNEFVHIIEPITLSRLECQDACYEMALDFYFNNTNRFDYDAPFHSFSNLFESKYLSQFWQAFFNESNSADPTSTCQLQCIDYEKNLTKFSNIINRWYDLTDADILIFPTSNQIPEVIGTSNLLLSTVFIASYTGYASLNVPGDFTKPSNNSAVPLPSGITFLGKPEDLVKLFVAAKVYEDNFKDTQALSSLLPTFEFSTCSRNHAARSRQPANYSILLSLISLLMILSFA